MKKAHGLLMLLLLAFLVSLPVAADGLAPSNDNALVVITYETKIVVKEEVAAVSGEMMTVQSVAPIPAQPGWSHYKLMVDTGREVDYVGAASINIDISAVRHDAYWQPLGGIRLIAGFA